MFSKGKETRVVASSLQDDLLGIQGVEGAEVDGSSDAPAGLRIRIAQGADQETVGGAIRRVLSAHGLGTDTQLPGEVPPDGGASPAIEESAVALLTDEDPPALDEPDPDVDRTVIDLTDAPATEDSTSEGRSAGEESHPETRAGTDSPDVDDLPHFVVSRESPVVDDASDTESSDSEDSPLSGGIARIESVAVVEGRSGIVVTVRASDGAEASQIATSTEGGVETAVVKAAARLIAPDSPDPIAVEIEDRRVEGVDIVMIILDADGELVTGSAVVGAGRPFALGRATWAALAL